MVKNRLQNSQVSPIEEWRSVAARIAKAARQILGDEVEVVVFGSVPKGISLAGSDVDILVVVPGILPAELKERAQIKANIEKIAELPLFHPFELHLVTTKLLERNPIYRTVLQEGVPV